MISWRVESAAGVEVTSKLVLATATVKAGESAEVVVNR
jgi:hypothetical protein